MANSEHESKLLKGKISTPMTPECLSPEIEYDEESDTLWLGNGMPAPNGMDLFDGCVVFFDQERRVTGIMVEDARELLLPYLKGESKERSKRSSGGHGTE